MAAEIILSLLFFSVTWALSARFSQALPLGERAFWAWAAGLFAAGAALRLLIGAYATGFTVDMDTFKAWAFALARTPLGEIYHQEDFFLDYPPGYLYVLLLLERLRGALGLPFDSRAFTLLLKLPSILADLGCAGVLLALGRRRLGPARGLFLCGCYLFCPVILANSAQWGQVDSFCAAILLASALLLIQEWYVPSALLYGFSIACKPQMLIFAPLYLFLALKRRRPGKLVLGVALTVAAVLATAAPFTEGWDFLWLLDRYRATLDYYQYYTINAYNFWAAIGFNWRALPDGLPLALLTWGAPALATGLCGVFLWKAKKPGAALAAPALLMAVMYLLGIKMHERYLYPAFLFLLLAAAFLPDRRLIRAFSWAALFNHLNVAHVLWLFREKGGNYDPNAPLTRLMALGQTAALLWLLWTLWAVFVLEREPRRVFPARRGRRPFPAAPAFPRRALGLADWAAMGGIMLLAAIGAFWRLGAGETALTAWTPAQGESVILTADGPCDQVIFLPGLAPDDARYAARVGVNIRLEGSEDGRAWTDLGTLEERGTYVFCWARDWLDQPYAVFRLTALDGGAALNEIGFKRQGESALAGLKASPGGEALADEQGTVPLETTYYNSTYFDEIYHARTAYEFLLGLEPYENTHPPLGKLLIAGGIALFGMCPFGWRFAGALFGVLTLPALYHLLHQLLGRTAPCALGTALFALDFMRFTQTRIATIDTYAVFFLLLMVDAMVAFLRRDLLRDPLKKLLPPLALSGVFTGLGLAAKWNVAYGAVGLAVLYFGKLFLTAWDLRRAGEDLAPFRRRALALCGWCCLFFLAAPFALYFAAFLPMTALPHNRGQLWAAFVRYQTTMFQYHSQLRATHYFASPWYEWPLDLRPIWYFSGTWQGRYSTIAALGNPLLWWAGLPALLAAVPLWRRERRPWAAVALVGYGSVYLPWALVPRLTFIYHYFTAVPFLVVALAGAFDRFRETDLGARRLGPVRVAQALPALFLLGCGALFCLYFPVLSGAPTDAAYVQALRLFESWYF